jgi:hypothetical protein
MRSVGFFACESPVEHQRTLRVEARLARLVLRHLVRGVLLAPLAERLLGFRHLCARKRAFSSSVTDPQGPNARGRDLRLDALKRPLSAPRAR